MTVFPPRNLPGEANEWGRAVESRLEGMEASLDRVSGGVDNSQRFTGGQLAVQGVQVAEQFARSTLLARPADLSVTGNATVEPFPRALRSIVFNPPAGARVAQVEVYADWVSGDPGNVNIYAYLSYEGKIISRMDSTFASGVVPTLSVATEPRRYAAFATVILPEAGTANFTLTMIRTGFTSTSTTETFTRIEAYLTPFQKTV